MMNFLKPRIVYGGGDTAGGGGSDKEYKSLSAAAKDGQHGNAVNIKGKGRQKVEFADKSYDKRMSTASANAGGGGGGTVAKAAKAVSEFGGRGPGGRYEPIPGPSTLAQRIKGSFDGTDSFHRPASNFKTINNSQRQALEAAGYSVTKKGTVKSRDGSATVAGSRWSRSNVVNQIMAENAEDRASVRSGGGGGKPAPVVPKKIVRPKLRPANLTAPQPAPPLEYDTLYTGDPGMTGDPDMFMSPYQVGPRPSTYNPSTFPGGGDPMLADPQRRAPLEDPYAEQQRRAPLEDPYADPQRRAPLVADPYISSILADERLGTYEDLQDSQRMAADQQLQSDSLTPSISDILREQQIRREFSPSIARTLPPGSYDSVGLGDDGFGKFLNDTFGTNFLQEEERRAPLEDPYADENRRVRAPLEDPYAEQQQLPGQAPEGVLSFMNPVGRVATDAEKAAGLDETGSTTLFEAGAYNIPRMGLGALQAFSDLVEEGLASWQDWDRYSKANEDGSNTFKTKINSFDEFGDPVRAEVTIPTPGRSEFSKSLDPYAGAARENAEAALARVNPKWRESLASGEISVDSVLAKVAYAGAPAAVSLATAVVNPVAAMVAGGSMAAGSAENQVSDIIDGMVSDGSLQNNPQYQAEIKAGKTPEAAVGSIKAQLNRQIVPAVTVIGGAGNAATSFLINQAKSKIGQQLITQSAVPTLTKAAVAGAGEEIIQEVFEDNAAALLSQVGGKQVKSTPDAKANILTGLTAGILGTGAAIPAIPSAFTRDPGQADADIDTVGTSPYTAIAAPETTVPLAQIAPPQAAAAAADVISGKPIITPPPAGPDNIQRIKIRPGVSPNLTQGNLSTPPPGLLGQAADMAISPEVLALPSPTGQLIDPVRQATLQNQRGFDPSQVDTAAAQAAAITPDPIDSVGTDPAVQATQDKLASEILQGGTIPNADVLAETLAAQAAGNAATADGLETGPVEAAAQGTLPGLDIETGPAANNSGLPQQLPNGTFGDNRDMLRALGSPEAKAIQKIIDKSSITTPTLTELQTLVDEGIMTQEELITPQAAMAKLDIIRGNQKKRGYPKLVSENRATPAGAQVNPQGTYGDGTYTLEPYQRVAAANYPTDLTPPQYKNPLLDKLILTQEDRVRNDPMDALAALQKQLILDQTKQPPLTLTPEQRVNMPPLTLTPEQRVNMPELVLTQDQLVPQSQLTNEQFLASLETDFSKDANARLAKSRAAALKENLAKAKARNPLMDDIISGFEAGEIGDSVTKPDGGSLLPGRDTIISETVAKEDLNKTPLLLTQEQMIEKINEPLIGSDTVTDPELSFEDALKNVNMNGASQDTLFNTLNPGDPQPSQSFKTPMSGLELQQSQDEAARVASLLAGQGRRQEGQTPDRNFPTDIPPPGTDTPAQQLARQLENQRRLQEGQLGGIGSLATVPPKESPLEGEILEDLGPFSRGDDFPKPEFAKDFEGEAVDLNQVPSPMGRADIDPFLYEGDVIDPVKTTDLVEAKAPVVDTIEGKIIDQTRRQQGQLGGIGSLNAAGKPVVRAPTFIDSEVLSPTDGTPYFPELPTDDVLPPEEREGGGPGGDDRPDVVPPMQTVDGEDGGCPPGYRRVLDPATGRYICLKIEEGSVGAPAAPSAPAEEEEDGAVIDIPVTERPTISPYYVPEPIESRYTPYVPGRR